MPSDFFSNFILIKRFQLVQNCTIVTETHVHCFLVAEFEEKRQNAVSKHERLQQEAQAVLDVIEKPEVAQALRQDKNQNLQYLRDNYQVCST